MKPCQSERAFRTFIAQRGADVSVLNPDQALDLALAFYSTQRASGVDLDGDGDMLLYRWGVFSVDGTSAFHFDLTRQFIWTSASARIPPVGAQQWDPSDAAVMSQLHLTLEFEATAELTNLGAGQHWCHHPAEALGFRTLVEASDAFRALQHAPACRRVEVAFELV